MPTTPNSDSERLEKARLDHEEASKKFGPDSPQAKAAAKIRSDIYIAIWRASR